MKILLFVLSVFGLAINTNAQKSNAADSIYIIEDSVMIPTRSGIDISAIIVRKKVNTQALPAILFYTTYFQGPGDNIFGKRSADRDFVGIVAYARGIRTDLKHYAPFEHEGTDIYDIIDWVSKQSWCNGQVGMFGGSYTGYSQWAAVKNIHPALKTIVPQVAVMPGYDFPMENNVPLPHILGWSNDIYKHKPLKRELVFDYFDKGIAFSKLDSLAGQPNPLFQKWLKHPSYDSYWQSMIPNPKEYANINIPVLSTTGYYDGSQIGAIEYFKQHYKNNNQANHYFVIGPYDHWGGQRRASKNLMGYEIDSVANISMMELAYQWLEHILKDKPKPGLIKDKFNYQVMGSNQWRHATDLKSINNDTLTLFLHNEKLITIKPKIKGFTPQIVDFKDRENQNSYYTPEIVFDSLDTGGGLVFTSEVFDKDFTINGSLAGNLVANTNKRDMDISLAYYELNSEGKYFFLSRYIGRSSYSKNHSKRQLLATNKPVTIPFTNTRFVSKKISKGSRLVVVLNINKHPFEIINYGSGKPVSEETIADAGKPMHIKWLNNSQIKIPINSK